MWKITGNTQEKRAIDRRRKKGAEIERLEDGNLYVIVRVYWW